MLKVLIVLVALAGPALAQAIEVVGNRRTHRDVIVAAANLPTGQLDATALAEARQRVLNLKLFETVEVTAREDGGVRVRVRERWTLFPVPFVTSSSRGTQGGLFVLESNLFGRNKTLAVGGSYASWGGAGFAFFQDPSVAGTRATLRTFASYASNSRERRVDDRVVAAYTDTRAQASLLAGYQLTPRLNVAAGWYLEHLEPEMAGVAMDVGYQHGPTAAIEYRGTNYRAYFDEGLAASITYKQARRALGAERDVHDVSGRVQYTRALLGDQATTVSAQVDVVETPSVVDARLLGGLVGTRGFEQETLWIDRAATVTLEHQVPVLVRRWGIWTVSGFVDVGATALDGEDATFVTPGAGVRLYLPKMNFPAIGFDVSYSPDVERLFATVSIGLSI